MTGIARLNDPISGTFSGEHSGHYPPHSSGSITGSISGNCSDKVFINQIPVAIVGSTTSEHDICSDGNGTVSGGSSKIFINGVAVARFNDTVTPHTTGSAHISGASDKVMEGSV